MANLFGRNTLIELSLESKFKRRGEKWSPTCCLTRFVLQVLKNSFTARATSIITLTDFWPTTFDQVSWYSSMLVIEFWIFLTQKSLTLVTAAYDLGHVFRSLIKLSPSRSFNIFSFRIGYSEKKSFSSDALVPSCQFSDLGWIVQSISHFSFDTHVIQTWAKDVFRYGCNTQFTAYLGRT
jgi:hypothetical protein